MPASLPPSIGTMPPVINEAPSPLSHATVDAPSSGWPTRRIGTACAAPCWAASPARRSCPVRIGPGATTFTRTPRDVYSSAARQADDPATAALDDEERAQLNSLLRRIAEQQALAPGVHPGFRRLGRRGASGA
jgi:hypothetical protein